MEKRLGSVFSVLVVSTLLASAAQARSIYCCKDDRGIDACSDILPQVCYGRAYREINERGITVKRVDAPLTAEQRAEKEAEKKRAREEEEKRLQQERKNRALLATYSSEKDIDFMRDRAVAELENAIKHARDKHDEVVKKQKKLADEAEFYKKKGMPPELKAAMRDNDAEMKTQQSIIEAKKKEIEEVKARYDEEKSRYRELTGGKKPAAAASAQSPAARPADPRPR